MKCLVWLFLLSNAFSSTSAMEFSSQYDITNTIRDTILGIFQTVEPQNIAKVIDSVINSDLVEIKTTPYEYGSLQWNKIKRTSKFYNLRITNASSENLYATYEFFNNKMKFSAVQFTVQLSGIMKLSTWEWEENLISMMHFSECTINAIKPTSNSDNSFLIDLQYNHLNTNSSGPAADWSESPQNLQRILPWILQKYMNRNGKLLHTLGKIYNDLSIKPIIAKHANFLNLEHLYHYLIPHASIGSLHLRNLEIRGLWNFHTLDFTTSQIATTYILLIKNIRGSMTLEDVSRTTLSTELMHFFIGSLSISVTKKNRTISAKAENFYIVKTKTNTPLTDAQSNIIMERVERSIAISLMPSMKYLSQNKFSSFPSEWEIKKLLRQILTETQTYPNCKSSSTKSTYSDQRPKTPNSFPSESKIENSLRQILTGTSFNPDNKISMTKSTYFDLTTATTPQKMNSSDEYDITDTLKDTIIGLFRNFRKRNVPQVIRQIDRFNYETKYNNCQDLRIVHGYLENTRIWFGFQNKTMQMHSVQLFLHLTGTVRINNIEPGFGSKTKFDRCSITVIEPKTPFEFPVVDFQYKNEYIVLDGEVVSTRYSIICPAEEVKKEIKSSINDMIKGNFWNKLTECFDHQPTKDIISKYPYFLGHEQEYYYLIPEALFGSFRLSNIIVNGLGNFHSLSFTDEPEVLTLEMKNIQGSLTLDESATGSSLELNFFLDSLSIGVTWNTSQINVEARNYSVFRTKINTKLSDLHSQPIIEYIESAIASSIMPSMKFLKTTRVSPFSSKSKMEKSIRKLLIEKSFQSDENDIEQSHNKCNQISFEGNRSSTKLPHSITNINPHYHLSFPNLTIIKFISGNQSHPEQIQCSLMDHSMFNHLINVVPFGKLLQNNDEGKSINVNFHFSAPFLNVSVTKRNNSKENDSCEFQISNNQDIEIHSSPAESNSTGSDDEQIEIKKKIDTTLMSMTKERIVRTVKSVVCLPFDVCTQSAKIIDKFFSSFEDNVLKKCSFRRNKT